MPQLSGELRACPDLYWGNFTLSMYIERWETSMYVVNGIKRNTEYSRIVIIFFCIKSAILEPHFNGRHSGPNHTGT
jgi:hypothetical protein